MGAAIAVPRLGVTHAALTAVLTAVLLASSQVAVDCSRRRHQQRADVWVLEQQRLMLHHGHVGSTQCQQHCCLCEVRGAEDGTPLANDRCLAGE